MRTKHSHFTSFYGQQLSYLSGHYQTEKSSLHASGDNYLKSKIWQVN